MTEAAIPEGSPFLPAPVWAATLESLRGHRERLEHHAGLVEALERAGDDDGAVAIAGAAAALAGTEHPGVQSSPRLEAVLERIASRRLPALTRPAPLAGERRVLHVVTEVYGTGGHTRALWRWMNRDPGSRHTLAATCQTAPVPDGVAAMARERGGDFVRLDPGAAPLERAAGLRRLASEADVVVVHHHPHDPVPTLALAAAAQRPPVVMFNHADHMFWLGASISDTLLSLRSVGAEIGREGRGIPGARHLVRPFPISGPDGNGRDASVPVGAEERSAARASVLGQLGWPQEAVLLATVGTAFKYHGPPGSTLPDLVAPVLEEAPAARLVAVGPHDAGPWSDLRLRTGGRVAAVGPIPDVGELLMAADVYLDSRPLGGQTASAEGAAAGLPALTCAASEVEAELICPDPLYGATVVRDVAEYRDLVRSLIADPDRRHDMGEVAREAVARADAGWSDAVEEAYALAERLGPMSAGALEPLPDEPGPREAVVHAVTALNRELSTEAVARISEVVELGAQSADVRRLFWWGSAGPGYPQQRLRYAVAFAAPPAEPAALTAAVEEFRRLGRAGVVERHVLALRPEDADGAVPVLEAAIAAGEDVDVDLQLVEDPQAVRPADSLEVPLRGPGAES